MNLLIGIIGIAFIAVLTAYCCCNVSSKCSREEEQNKNHKDVK